MSSSTRSPMFSLDDGGSVVKTILSILFMAIICSMIHRVYYQPTSDLSKAEVNVDFGDSGDIITASATIKVEASVSDDADSTLKEVKVPWSIPDVNLQTSNILHLSLPKCCNTWNPDCSWLEQMVEVICKIREEAWSMTVKVFLMIRDFFKGLLIIACDFLALLLTKINILIQHVDCNTSSNPWEGCSSKLLRGVLDVIDEKDKIALSWITSYNSNGPIIVSRVLISLATVLGFLIIIVLCVFFENSPQKNKIIQKLKGVLGNAPTEDSSSSSSSEFTNFQIVKTNKKTEMAEIPSSSTSALSSSDEPETMSSEEDEGEFNFRIKAVEKKEMLAVEPPKPNVKKQTRKSRSKPRKKSKKQRLVHDEKTEQPDYTIFYESAEEEPEQKKKPSRKIRRKSLVHKKKTEIPEYSLFKKDASSDEEDGLKTTTIIVEEDIFKTDGEEKERTVEARLEIKKTPSENPEDDMFQYELVVGVDPDTKDSMEVDVQGQVKGKNMDVHAHAKSEGEGVAGVRAGIQQGDERDEGEVELSISDNSDSSSSEMNLKAGAGGSKKKASGKGKKE